MSDPRPTANTITDDQLEDLHAERDVYATAWRSARDRALVLSDELTRRAPLANEYAATIARLEAELVTARSTLDRVREARDRIAGASAIDAIYCLDLLDAALDGTEQPTTETRTTYFIQSRPAPDQPWQQHGVRFSWESKAKALERLAWRREQRPGWEHRLMERTTTVTEQSAEVTP